MSERATQPEELASLYARAVAAPTAKDALVVARALRIEGDRDARGLAEQIERACRATD